MKWIVTGIESSGKSLLLAKKAQELVQRNSVWYSKTGVKRPIRSNMQFSRHFERYAEHMNVPIIYWKQLHEIIYIEESDIIMDEIVKFFNARAWADMSMDAMHFLTQGAKSGIHLYGACQDFSQIDKSFRLLINELTIVTKIIGSPRPMKTRPTNGRVWGICMTRKVRPSSFKGDNVTLESLEMIPSFFLITKEDCAIFDTSAKIKESDPLPLRRIQRHWTNPETQKVEYTQTRYV